MSLDIMQNWWGSLVEWIPLVATSLLVLAAYTDIRYRRISNWLSVSLLILFPLFVLGASQNIDLWLHFLWGGSVLAILLPVFAFGKIGGGDVKLLATVTVWCGPAFGFEFLLLTALLGGIMALFVIQPFVRDLWEWAHYRLRISATLSLFPEKDSLPYGVAIAVSGSAMITRMYMN